MREELLIVIACLRGEQANERFLPAVLHAHECAQEIDQPLSLGCTPENVQARTDLHVLDVGHIVVEARRIIVEVIALINLILKMTGTRLFTDDILHRLDIVRLRRTEVNVLIESLLELFEFLESSCQLHRRGEMTDEARRTAAFCLNPLPNDRDPVGIDVRQIAQRHIRVTSIGQAGALPRQPLERSVCSDVDHGIRLPDIAQPVIVPDVVMRRCSIGRMQELPRILTKPAWRLHRDEQIPVQRARDEQCPVIAQNVAGFITPVSHELRPHLRGQLREKCPILLCRQLSVRRLCQRRTHKAAVIRRVIRQQLHKRLAALRNLIHKIARRAHCREQTKHALRRIKTRSASDVRIRRRIVMENNGNLLLRVRLMPQRRPLACLARDPLHALIEGCIADLTAFVAHLRCDRYGMDHAVKLRHGNAHRDLHRIKSRRRALPLLLLCKHSIRLENGHAEFIEVLNARAACLDGELHRTDDHVDKRLSIPAEVLANRIHQRRRLYAFVTIGIGKHSDRVHPLRLDCTNERSMVGEVPRNPFRTVKDHPDRRTPFLVMRGEISRDVLGIPRPVRMIDAIPRERTRRLCCAGKPSELSAEPVKKIAHILLAVIAKICPCRLDLLLRESICHLIMIGIVHDDQVRRPIPLQIA